MKIILFLFIFFISKCYSETALSIWNVNSTTAAIGIYDLPSHTILPKFLLEDAQHLYPSNQYSTFNKNTRLMSFLVNSSIDNSVSLHTINVDSWEQSSTIISFDGLYVLSIVSCQTSTPNDLFVILSDSSNSSSFIVAKINYLTGAYNVVDAVNGYIFGSASFDQQKNYFVIMMLNPNTGSYIVDSYSISGTNMNSVSYSVSNLAPGYSVVGSPQNLVYIPQYSSFFFNINLKYSGSDISYPQLFQFGSSSKSFTILPVISKSCNSNASGIVQALDSDNNRVLYQFFKCPGNNVQQKINTIGPLNLGVYQTPFFIINAWN